MHTELHCQTDAVLYRKWQADTDTNISGQNLCRFNILPIIHLAWQKSRTGACPHKHVIGQTLIWADKLPTDYVIERISILTQTFSERFIPRQTTCRTHVSQGGHNAIQTPCKTDNRQTFYMTDTWLDRKTKLEKHYARGTRRWTTLTLPENMDMGFPILF